MKKYSLLFLLLLFVACFSDKKKTEHKKKPKNEKTQNQKPAHFISSFVGDEHFSLKKIDSNFNNYYIKLKSYYLIENYDNINNNYLNFFDEKFNRKVRINSDGEGKYYWDVFENLYVINNDEQLAIKYLSSSNYIKQEIIPYHKYKINDLIDKNEMKNELDSIRIKLINLKSPTHELRIAEDACRLNSYTKAFEKKIKFKNLKGYIKTLNKAIFLVFDNNQTILIDFGIDLEKIIQKYSLINLKNVELGYTHGRKYINYNNKSKFLKHFHQKVMGYYSVGANHFSFGSKIPYGHEFYYLLDKKDTTVLFSCKSDITVILEKEKIIFNDGTIYKVIINPE